MGLQGALNGYLQELRELQEESGHLMGLEKSKSSYFARDRSKHIKELFRNKTYNARIRLSKVEALIMRLRKDARLELK